MKITVITWRDAYLGLRQLRFNNDQIAELAGTSRSVISNVVNGKYAHTHEPSYSGGLRALRQLVKSAKARNTELELVKGDGAPQVLAYVPEMPA